MLNKETLLALGALLVLVLFVTFRPTLSKTAPAIEPFTRVEVDGFASPESVALGPDGNYYVSNIGAFGLNGDGSIRVIHGNPFSETATVTELAAGLDDPKGVLFVGDTLFVADITKLLAVGLDGTVTTFLEGDDFPGGARLLNDIDADEQGNLYITDTTTQRVFKVDPQGNASVFADLSETMNGANGILFDREGLYGDPGGVLVLDFRSPGALVHVSPDGQTVDELARGFQGDGLAFNTHGLLYASDARRGVLSVTKDGATAVVANGFIQAADFIVDHEKNWLIVTNLSGTQVSFIQLD